MMCNGVGVDCIAVTSDDHEWNKVRINDSWYNVDCTWADQSTIDYEYFERSDAVYDADLASYASSHAEESYWSEYLPACTLDSGATYSDPGTLPTITQQTAQPQISVTANNNVNYVTITSSTPNAIIYYTINGDTPTPAYTRSEKYSSTFTLSGSCTVKAVAVCDTYWDSNGGKQECDGNDRNDRNDRYIGYDGHNNAAQGGAVCKTVVPVCAGPLCNTV